VSPTKLVGDLKSTFRRVSKTLLGRQFSNFDEERIIAKYVADLDITDRTVVDIGAGDGVRWSNSYRLLLDGWRGVSVEADADKFRMMKRNYAGLAGAIAHHAPAQPETISGVLREYGIPREFGVLTLDIDGNDYYVLDAILNNFRPRLIVSEYNEKIPPPIKFVVKFDPNFYLRHHFYGYSLAKLEDLCSKHGYSVIDVEYNNVFLTPSELAKHRSLSVEMAYERGYRNRPDRRDKFPQNDNMEVLLEMPPEKGIEFLDGFYREYEGKYEIGI
jgi:hypothetical protein